jgi:hypothetical protein
MPGHDAEKLSSNTSSVALPNFSGEVMLLPRVTDIGAASIDRRLSGVVVHCILVERVADGPAAASLMRPYIPSRNTRH